ncbi:S49 family peptidase [Methylobacterium durans]|uniref:Peptidase S49 n=1 Tax=Methylobacterium durans TaxID=2202825 RepID=A0A2U8WCI8_9HYPH|nr:S49 family peptidase [Methylobacterium durans]AWN43160.1 peptidase S49 [Methylobacterium durans]
MSNPLLARFASRPSLVAPEMREWFEGCLTAAASHPRAAEMLEANAYADDGFWPAPDDWRAAYRPYVVRDGVLQIPVKGVLLHDFSFALGGWATGYVYIQRAFDRGLADPTVRGIALVCDSPGGHVAGNFDLVDRMFAARGTKPIRAFAHEAAYSAAYSIASAADQIVVSRTGGVGSIGVVAAHYDVSGAMEQAGVKVTFIYAGRHKVNGNAFEALPNDVKARFQARIDELYGTFVTTVARNRGLNEQAVRDTEALCFTATEAVSNKLADSTDTLDDAVAAFAADCNPSQEEDENDMITPEAHEAAVAAARADGETAGRKAGDADAKARIKAIQGSEEAKGRQAQATHLAMETDMTAESAIALLATLPKAEGAKPGNRFEEAMAAAGNPQVGLEPAANQDDGVAYADAYFAAKRQKRSA